MAPDRKYMLVLQVPLGTMGDFDRLIEAAERIDALLKDLGQVAGHEDGSGEGNLFIRTDLPELALQKALPCLDERIRDLARAAYRDRDGEDFTILWPPGLTEFRVI